MSELIERMKKNKIPFGLLSKEEQECLRKTAKENNIEVYEGDKWARFEMSVPSFSMKDHAYRIKADYKPEAEIERCEVKPTIDGNVLTYNRCSTGYSLLNAAPNDPDFIAYEYEGGLRDENPRIRRNGNKHDTDSITADIPKYVLFRKDTK